MANSAMASMLLKNGIGSSTVLINHQSQRGMANLKAIAIRLKSIKNIQKITQSMKMVSAAKYARAERDLKAAKPYGSGSQAFYDAVEIKPLESETGSQKIGKTMYVALSSDRGLCGGIHSSICRTIRNELLELKEGGSDTSPENVKLVCVGDKSRAQLSRLFAENILCVGSEIGRLPPQFGDAVRIADAILQSGFEYDKIKIYYNRFKSVVSYSTEVIDFYPIPVIESASNFSQYDSLDSEVLKSYVEYSLASIIYSCLKEGACSEQSARMSAMDNSTKNAGEIIDKLTLVYNRTRQSVITGELIEIISGAAALE